MMSAPSTPQKQLVELEQLPSPPPTAVARKIRKEDENSPTLCDDSVKQSRMQQLDRPKNEIQLWLDKSRTPEQRHRRFDSILNALWPSNRVFNDAARKLYDPEEDLTEELFVHRTWDGECPLLNDDYDIRTDPSQSEEIWQPKIGDEGIENEEDLRIVLKARYEHEARSKAFRKRRAQVIIAHEKAGISAGNIDKLQILLGPEIDDSDSEEEEEEEEGDEISKPTVQIGAHSATTDSPFPGKPTFQTTIVAKGISVFGSQEPSSGRGRPRGSKNKKGRKARKRRRGPNANPNGTYKYDSGSEDEQPPYKKAKKGKSAAGKTAADDPVWQAQTRAAARRTQHAGTDGTYEMD